MVFALGLASEHILSAPEVSTMLRTARERISGLIALVALATVLYGAIYVYVERGSQRDALALGNNTASFQEVSARLVRLAEEKGARYALSVLEKAHLPPNTDLHLLGHVAGDALYAQEGIAGMAACTDAFRNACSHSIVIGAFDEFGEAALPHIADACKGAPGGPGAYTMCFHGLGHGVFAYYSYSFTETIEICKRVGTASHQYQEDRECVSGAVMELMGGGGHDREAWQKARARYFSTTDPLAPCNTDAIPPKHKSSCYQYLTPHLFEAAGADLARPQPKHFRQAFVYCQGEMDDGLRNACLEGIGKEFPTLSVRQDIRALSHPPEEALDTMRTWCTEAPTSEGYDACLRAIVRSLYWGGERTMEPPLSFCARTTEEASHRLCVETLLEEAGKYAPQDVTGICAREEGDYPQCSRS